MAEILQQTKGKEDKALECYEKALKISKSLYGSENFKTLECFLNLAQLYEILGKKEEADRMFNQCLLNFDKKENKNQNRHKNNSD